MSKFIVGVLCGVFVGALVVEVVSATHPELVDGVRRKAKEAGERVGDMVRARRIGRPVY